MIVIEQWAGLATNASPYAIKPGTTVTQVNLQVLSPGELTVRPGSTALTFVEHTGSTAAIWKAARYPAYRETIVYQSRDGVVRVAQGPS